LDRIFETVGAILDFAEDRSTAWTVAAGAALATLASWWFALSRSVDALGTGAAANAPLTSADRLLAVVAVFAPFVLVNAAWQGVATTGATAKTSEDYGPMTSYYAADLSERRRRQLLTAALAGALNGLGMYIATHKNAD